MSAVVFPKQGKGEPALKRCEMSADLDLYAGFKVSSIATPREGFATCTLGEALAKVVARNTEKYDFMPVLDANGTLVGVVKLAEYFQAPAPHGTVENHFDRLGEHHLIGADAGILDFLLDADRRRFRFLVSQKGIVGLVSLSDLQKLPVRATLFSLITSLELAMLDVIRRAFPDPQTWLLLLKPKRQAHIEKHVKVARSGDGAVENLLYTQFCDKRDILLGSLLGQHAERKKALSALKKIEKLRNALAHANKYGETTLKAVGVCKTVNDLLHIKSLIESLHEQNL